MFNQKKFARFFKEFCDKHLIEQIAYDNRDSSYVLVYGLSKDHLVVRFSNHANTSPMFKKPDFNVLDEAGFKEMKRSIKSMLRAV